MTITYFADNWPAMTLDELSEINGSVVAASTWGDLIHYGDNEGIGGTQPELISTNAEPYDLDLGGGSKTLTIKIDGEDAVTVTLEEGDFADDEAASADEIADVINADVGIAICYAYETDDNKVCIASRKTGASASVEVTGGTANTIIGFSTTEVSGEGGAEAVRFDPIPDPDVTNTMAGITYKDLIPTSGKTHAQIKVAARQNVSEADNGIHFGFLLYDSSQDLIGVVYDTHGQYSFNTNNIDPVFTYFDSILDVSSATFIKPFLCTYDTYTKSVTYWIAFIDMRFMPIAFCMTASSGGGHNDGATCFDGTEYNYGASITDGVFTTTDPGLYHFDVFIPIDSSGYGGAFPRITLEYKCSGSGDWDGILDKANANMEVDDELMLSASFDVLLSYGETVEFVVNTSDTNDYYIDETRARATGRKVS